MKKQLPIYLYGAISILVGIFLLFSADRSFNNIKLTLGISLTIGALFSFISAWSSRKSNVEFAYHEMHALAMIVYGAYILFFCKSLEMLTSLTAFLFFFYAFSEIIFCNRVFELASRVINKIVIVRLLLALAIGVGTMLAMNASEITLEGFGILFVLVGINIILYAPVMKSIKYSK